MRKIAQLVFGPRGLGRQPLELSRHHATSDRPVVLARQASPLAERSSASSEPAPARPPNFLLSAASVQGARVRQESHSGTSRTARRAERFFLHTPSPCRR